MSATYDETLPTGKDWVRFLTRETNTATTALSDEEINALLDMQTATGNAAYYFAAAEAVCLLQAEYAKAGKGLSSKSVEHLTLEWGMESGVMEALEYHARFLRRRGARLLNTRPFVFRTGGRSTTRDVRFDPDE